MAVLCLVFSALLQRMPGSAAKTPEVSSRNDEVPRKALEGLRALESFTSGVTLEGPATNNLLGCKGCLRHKRVICSLC